VRAFTHVQGVWAQMQGWCSSSSLLQFTVLNGMMFLMGLSVASGKEVQLLVRWSQGQDSDAL
jgi:hypothetical protein